MRPDAPLTDLFCTIERMERRLAEVGTPEVQALMLAYQELVPQFERDLESSPNDVALAKASALMLVQQVAARADESLPVRPLLRAARPVDLPDLLTLYAQLHPEDTPLELAHARTVLEEILQSRHLEVVVAEVGGMVVGSCYLNVIPNLTRGARPYAVLENVIVHERCRGRGIGRELVRHALAQAWERGCYKVMAQSAAMREPAHAFYRACGFDGDEKAAFVSRPR